MGTKVLESLECVVQRDETRFPPSKALRRVEYQLAVSVTDCLGVNGWSCDKAAHQLLDSCGDDLPLAVMLLKQPYSCSATLAQRLRAWFAAKLSSGEVRQRVYAERIIAVYQINDEFVGLVAQAVNDLDQMHQYCELGRLTWMQTGGLAQSRALFGRSVFLGLRALWNEEESGEPILWRISKVLESIAENGSHLAITEALGWFTALGLVKLTGEAKADTLRDFLVQANDDANGNLLDNLILAERTYHDLVVEGWKPDRWEIENLPMTVGLYLRFMVQMGVEQTEQIGRRLQITLREAQETYRYSGSPFASSDERKEVVVQTPGWTYQGELIVRPKVREATQ
jgi:hypothetical protein